MPSSCCVSRRCARDFRVQTLTIAQEEWAAPGLQHPLKQNSTARYALQHVDVSQSGRAIFTFTDYEKVLCSAALFPIMASVC